MALTVLLGAFTAIGTSARAEPFHFVAYGDVVYRIPENYAPYERLIETINRDQPAFTIHVGDFKGYFDCGDEMLARFMGYFDRHDQPLMLTPGDNDWTDCWTEEAGGYDPLERLARLRDFFYGKPVSLGTVKRPVVRQADEDAANPQAVENLRWREQDVIFATIHIVGPHNNFVVDHPDWAEDAMRRIAAGKAWLRHTFEIARDENSPALVIAFHVDPFSVDAPQYPEGPVAWIKDMIVEEAANFPGQVLMIHGDGHRFEVDQPLRRIDPDAGTITNDNITRLHVFGWPHHRAVRVTVDTSKPWVFGFEPLYPAD